MWLDFAKIELRTHIHLTNSPYKFIFISNGKRCFRSLHSFNWGGRRLEFCLLSAQRSIHGPYSTRSPVLASRVRRTCMQSLNNAMPLWRRFERKVSARSRTVRNFLFGSSESLGKSKLNLRTNENEEMNAWNGGNRKTISILISFHFSFSKIIILFDIIWIIEFG